MFLKIDCIYAIFGGYCRNKHIRRSLFGIGARCCVKYFNTDCNCQYQIKCSRPQLIPKIEDTAQVGGNHPLAEVIARKLSGIGGMSIDEQRKMICRAASAAVEWHKSESSKLVTAITHLIETSNESSRRACRENSRRQPYKMKYPTHP